MKKKILLSLFIASLAIDSFALSIPEKSHQDKRVLTATYNENDVTRLYAKNGYTTILKLEQGEKVIDKATGFNDGWDITSKRNYVFIKPIAYVSKISTDQFGQTSNRNIVIEPNKRDWSTNLILTTNKREYLFDLILAKHEVYFKVDFFYPKSIQKQKDQEIEAKKLEQEKDFIKKELAKPSVPKNWDFYMNINKDSEDIAPIFAYDDGAFTYLGFDTTKTIPSVFLYDNEQESILNTHIKKDGKNDVLVIHKTGKMIVLRSGKKIVGILNNGYAKNPLKETKTTINRTVQREVIDGKQK
jgi:type IV secretion system protein VirB9